MSDAMVDMNFGPSASIEVVSSAEDGFLLVIRDRSKVVTCNLPRGIGPELETRLANDLVRAVISQGYRHQLIDQDAIEAQVRGDAA